MHSVIRLGSTGLDVVAWQKFLGLTADGIFGPKTEQATKDWQYSKGLVADGVVGPLSWSTAGIEETEPTHGDGAIPYVQAKNFSRANRTKINLIVIHTMEAPEMQQTAENVANFFASQPAQGAIDPKWSRKDANGNLLPWAGSSTHYNIDSDSIVRSVPDEYIAWHANQVNDRSIGLEHAGYASQTPDQWKDDYSTSMLLRSAKLAADLCVKYGIPPRRLTPDDVKSGLAGLCGHVDVTNAYGNLHGHQDPGPNFPWDWYMQQVQGFIDPPTVEPKTNDDGNIKWVEVTLNGVVWEVAPDYIAPVGIGEAEALAKSRGCELPTKELVDAIWMASDLKIDSLKTVETGFKTWSMAEMSAKSVVLDHQAKVAAAIAGRQYRLLGGGYKDVIRAYDAKGNEFLALYGWQQLSGKPIQPVFGGHAHSWIDYSQGLRLCRKKQ